MTSSIDLAKREASDLWLGRVAGVEAVRSGELEDGSSAIIVSCVGTNERPLELPETFQGFPVVVENSSAPIRPLNRPP